MATTDERSAADAAERALAEREAVRVLGGPIDRFERLTHSRVTAGVWRVGVGDASAVLKVLRRPVPGGAEDDPRDYRYWLREAFAYDGGIPEAYGRAGIRGPRLRGRFDRPDRRVALWLEDVAGIRGESWEPGAFEEAAERLGRAQGAYLAGTALPDDRWLSRGFLRQYLANRGPRADPSLLERDDLWALPVIARNFPADLREALVRLRADRARFLHWLDAVPRTVAHLDVWPGNLFAQSDSTVLVDWAFAGIAAAGEDAGNLVPDSVFDLYHPPALLEALDAAVFAGYVRGVRGAGWTGDERWLRLGVCASAVKYDWIAAATLDRAAGGGTRQPIYGRRDADADAFFAVRAAVLRFLAGWADEARFLARSLGLS